MPVFVYFIFIKSEIIQTQAYFYYKFYFETLLLLFIPFIPYLLYNPFDLIP